MDKDKAYSPDLNPIDQLFSKLKAWLRSAKARTVDGVIEAMGDVLLAVRPVDILGWLGQNGYDPRRSSHTANKRML